MSPWLAGSRAGFCASRGRHAISPNHIKPALPVASSCQERRSQGPQHRKQETAAFLSSDEEHCHMATHRPQPPPGGSASNPPSPWAMLTWSDGDAFNFPFLVGGRSRLCGHRLRNGRHSPPGPAAPSPPPSRPLSASPFPPPSLAASSPQAYPGEALCYGTLGRARNRESPWAEPQRVPGVGLARSRILEDGCSLRSSAEAMMAFSGKWLLWHLPRGVERPCLPRPSP